MAGKRYAWRNGQWIDTQTMEVIPESKVPDEYLSSKALERRRTKKVNLVKTLTVTEPASGKTETPLEKSKRELEEEKKKVAAMKASLKKK